MEHSSETAMMRKDCGQRWRKTEDFAGLYAFLAKVESKNYKIKWRLEESEKQLRCHLNGTKEKNVNVLGAILVGWARKGEDLIKRLIDTFEDYNPNYS